MAKTTLILKMLLTMMTLLTTRSAESVLRTNFGYSMETLNAQVYFATDKGRIVFSSTMPQLIAAEKSAQQESEENKAFSNPCAQEKSETHLDSLFRLRCRYILNIVKKIFDLRRQALYLVHHKQREINALIADITNLPRQKRGLGSFMGSGIAWTFDLATGENVKQLRSLLRQVLSTTNKALSASTVGQNLITRVTKLTSSRFDQIDRLVNLTRLSLIKKNRQMQNLKMEGYSAQRLLSVVVEQIGEIVTRLQKTESLYLALKDLSVGRLSHHLIETKILQDYLNILGETIKRHNPKAKIVYPFVHYYYTVKKIASAIHKYLHENILVVVVDVPLTLDELTAPMSIWEVRTFPRLSPDGRRYYTKLTDMPKFIIYNSENKYYAVANDRQNLPCTDYQRFG